MKKEGENTRATPHMGKMVAIVVGIIVGASCIPGLRHQHFFSVLVGVTAVALIGLMVFEGMRAMSTWSRRKLLQPGSTQSSWLSPRFRTLSLGAAFVLALMLTVPHFMATSEEAYKLAVATAHETPQFGETLGVPIREGWFSEGKVEFGNPARAELLIPVRGRIRNGNLRALAVKDDGRWRLKELTLELAQPDERIDLLRSIPAAIQDH